MTLQRSFFIVLYQTLEQKFCFDVNSVMQMRFGAISTWLFEFDRAVRNHERQRRRHLPIDFHGTLRHGRFGYGAV